MAARCTVCRSSDRAAVERALIAGASLRDIARRFSLGKDAISRHQQSCARETIQKRSETRELALADRLLEEIARLQAKTQQILDDALKPEGGDPRTALAAIHEARHNVALVARMTGRLDPRQDQDKRDRHMMTWEEFVVMYRSRSKP